MEKDTLTLFSKEAQRKENSWHFISSKLIIHQMFYLEIRIALRSSLFIILWSRDEEVVAAASLNFDPAVARLAEMLLMGKRITKAQAQWVSISYKPSKHCIHNWTMNSKAIIEFICMHFKSEACLEDIIQDFVLLSQIWWPQLVAAPMKVLWQHLPRWLYWLQIVHLSLYLTDWPIAYLQ